MARRSGNYSTNSGIFEKRGDPWISQREAVRDFQRTPETENAELDFDYRFHNTGFGPKAAAPRPIHQDPKPAPRDEDYHRRKASIARRLHSRMNKRAEVVEVTGAERHFQPCAGCRSAQCVADACCYGSLR